MLSVIEERVFPFGSLTPPPPPRPLLPCHKHTPYFCFLRKTDLRDLALLSSIFGQIETFLYLERQCHRVWLTSVLGTQNWILGGGSVALLISIVTNLIYFMMKAEKKVFWNDELHWSVIIVLHRTDSLAVHHSWKLVKKEKGTMISSSHKFPGTAALCFHFHGETESLEVHLQVQYGVSIA